MDRLTLVELDQAGALIKLGCRACHRVVRMRPGHLTLQNHPDATPEDLRFVCRCGNRKIEVTIVRPRPEDEERNGLDLMTWSEVVEVVAWTIEAAVRAGVQASPTAVASMIVGNFRACGLEIVARRRDLTQGPKRGS